jgi:TetR/AcrR family transcriptional repressor of lmrAB and yxaGH operons
MASARDQIIETTCALIELQGYHATGLNQIIKESGSPKGSLYHYFPGGKEELAEQSIVYVGGLVHARIAEQLATADAPDAAVRSFIMMVAQQVERAGYRGGGPITTIALEAASTSDRLREACARTYDGWRQLFVGKLMSDGFSQDRAERLGTLIIAALEGGIILARTQRSPEPLTAIADEIGMLIALSV